MNDLEAELSADSPVDVDVSFDAFVRAERARSLRLAVLLAGDVSSGQDLLQTAHEQLYRRYRKHGIPDFPDRYMRTCLVRAASRSWRLGVRRGEVLVQDTPDGLTAAHDATVVARQHLLPALRRLTPRQRHVLALRYFADLSEAETAELLGCSVGTVKSLTHRALVRLRADQHLADAISVEGEPT